MAKYILAHDLGTTGNKATLYDEHGRLVSSAFSGYVTDYPKVNWAEQDANDWWTAVCNSTRELINNSNIKQEEVAVISFSGQMMGCLPLDEQGSPLRKAIIWADQRSTVQAQQIADSLGEDKVYQITGHRISPTYSVEKMMWIRDNQPQIYQRTHKFMHAKDFIIHRLTGRFVTDYSDSGGMNLYDMTKKEWSRDILRVSQIDEGKLPEVVSSFDIVGEVRAAVADEVGLVAGTPVVAGGGDGVCAGVGAGVVREGSAYNYVGSSSWVALVTPEPILDPERKTFNWIHMDPSKYMPCGTMQTAGGSYGWLKQEICKIEQETARQLNCSPYELMNLQVEKSNPTADGLLYLPYLMGERSPHWNPNARGAFIGLSLKHGREDVIRAVLEGVTFNLRIIIDAFEKDFTFDKLRVIGGGAKGRVWRQIMADIYGKEVLLPEFVDEATSLGAAIAGGIGVGIFPDLESVEKLNPVLEVQTPNPQNVHKYNKVYPLFKQAYQSLLAVYDGLAELEN